VSAAMRMLTRSADITASEMSNDVAASSSGQLLSGDEALSRRDLNTWSKIRCKFSLSTAQCDNTN